MNKFLQLIVLVALAFYNAIQTVTGGATLKRLAPSGVIDQGILGGFSGKVGPVVGGKWKDIDYMRGYVVPANPNTPAQQAVRAKFSALVAYGRQILSGLLQPFWDPYFSNMSGFNAWISQNYALADVDGIIDETAIMTKGTLSGCNSVSATYDTSTGDIVVTHTTENGGNGEATDVANVVIFETTSNTIIIGDSPETRGDSNINVGIDSGFTATNVIVYLYFYRGTGSELIVSDSQGVVCTAA